MVKLHLQWEGVSFPKQVGWALSLQLRGLSRHPSPGYLGTFHRKSMGIAQSVDSREALAHLPFQGKISAWGRLRG